MARVTAKPRRVRPGNNIKYLRQRLEDLQERMSTIESDLRTELNRLSSERRAAITAAHDRIAKCQRMWDRLANYVAKLARELDE